MIECICCVYVMYMCRNSLVYSMYMYVYTAYTYALNARNIPLPPYIIQILIITIL